MKQRYLALAAGALLAAAGAAQAADIQIYGRVDSGLRYTHTKSSGEDSLVMRHNRSTPRVGFNIVEDLGNGMKVKAYLENGFTLDDGALGTDDTLFDRRAILAVAGAWGELGMGRMGTVHSTVSPYTMGLIKYDPFGTSYGQASIGTVFANTSRVNNAVTWISPKASGWKVGVTYSLGDKSDEALDNGDGTETPYEDYCDRNHTFAAAADYSGDNVYFSVSYANVAYGSMEAPEYDHDANLFAVGGWYRFIPEAKIYAGAQYQSHWTKGANLTLSNLGSSISDEEKAGGFDGYSLLLGADYVVGQHKVIGGVQYFEGELANDSSIDHQFTVLAAAYEYKLAKTTWLYVAATQSLQTGEAKNLSNKEASEIMVGLNLNW